VRACRNRYEEYYNGAQNLVNRLRHLLCNHNYDNDNDNDNDNDKNALAIAQTGSGQTQAKLKPNTGGVFSAGRFLELKTPDLILPQGGGKPYEPYVPVKTVSQNRFSQNRFWLLGDSRHVQFSKPP
jgi:hypothetical protein